MRLGTRPSETLPGSPTAAYAHSAPSGTRFVLGPIGRSLADTTAPPASLRGGARDHQRPVETARRRRRRGEPPRQARPRPTPACTGRDPAASRRPTGPRRSPARSVRRPAPLPATSPDPRPPSACQRRAVRPTSRSWAARTRPGSAPRHLDDRIHAVGDRLVPSASSRSRTAHVRPRPGRPREEPCARGSASSRTGEPFNAITLAPGTGMPLNPMVNAGAITAPDSSRPGRASGARPPPRRYARFAGRPLAIDSASMPRNGRSGHRNRAIGQLLRASARSTASRTGVETYFAQCSGRSPRSTSPYRRHARQRRRGTR